MNDSELEDHLRVLAPATPSADLAARIGRQLAPAHPVTRTAGTLVRPTRAGLALGWLRDLGWAGAGAAAMLAGVLLLPTSKKPAATEPAATALVAPSQPAADEQAFEPAENSRELIAVNDSDELLDTDDGPVREVRYTYLERLAWAHPGTGARLEIEVPREDVYLMPISLQ